MNEIITYLSILAVILFVCYWFVKFKIILPLETKLTFTKKTFSAFTSFSKDLLEHIYIPDTLDHYTDIVNYYLIKLHNVLPESNMLVFEKVDNQWKLINYFKNFKHEPKIMAGYDWDVFDKAAQEKELIRVNISDGYENISIVSLLKTFDVNVITICPFMWTASNHKRLLIIGHEEDENPEKINHYLKLLLLHINAIYKVSEKNIALKKDNNQLRNEINAVLKELDMAGSKLIQRAKERKALYEVVTQITGDNKDVHFGSSAILNIVAKIVEADVAACLIFDEDKNSLEVYPGAYGIKDEDYYGIQITNMESSSVRVFTENKPFISSNAQTDNEVLTKYARLWNIQSLMVVPIALHGKIIGVLRIGSSKENFFTEDQLEFLVIIADELAMIIEMVTLYDNLSKTAKELAQSNNMKDEFLAAVSHELKTPLTTIKGFISVILSGEAGSLTPQQRKFLNITDQAVGRLNNLISDLLDLSRLTGKVEMEFEEVSIEDLIRHSTSNLIFKAKEKHVKFHSKTDKKLKSVMADPKWLTRVIDNLLVNALKFSEKDSEIKITVHNKGEAVVVGVGDSGPGIEKGEQRLIFDKFYRGKNNSDKTPGTGLGLAISKSVVEKHGGKMWVESEINEGAKFFFALPFSKKKIQVPAQSV
ncbi:MAG: HAMP domain-containing sensor histidine kinase, partial [Elusimicrobiota bacterium]|nr:HAMP domain-containing sensor histidine kinase [Elusimicrobiota bacterium]